MTRRSGFALMAAMWLLVAIGGIAAEMSLLARSRRLIVANTIETMQAEAAAASGIEHARARLTRALVRGDERRWNDATAILDPWQRLTNDSAVVSMGTARYRVILVDVGTRLHLNRVTEAGLRAYFIAKGIDALLADALSQSIMDWRDGDDFRRSRGAEREDYLKADAPELARNGPFESVDELKFVKGMTPAVFDRVRDDFTVLGGGQVGVNTAPREVLMSLPGMTLTTADRVLAMQRSRQRIDNVQQLMDAVPAESRAALQQALLELMPRVTFDTHEVEALSEGWTDGSPVRVRQRALLARAQTVAFVTWRHVD
jgi:type II secretory pathway component PulK